MRNAITLKKRCDPDHSTRDCGRIYLPLSINLHGERQELTYWMVQMISFNQAFRLLSLPIAGSVFLIAVQLSTGMGLR